MQRIIVRDFINGESKSLKEMGLENINIEKCWTIYDEEKMWDYTKFNPYTGQPIIKGVDLDGLILSHNEGVFIEDPIHDWYVSGDSFKYYSRFISLGNPATILLEFK